MRSYEDIAAEALSRASILIKEKEAKRNAVCFSLAAVACLCMVIGISFAMSRLSHTGTAIEIASFQYATLIAGSEMGSYVIVGVASFLLGVAMVILCIRMRNKRK